MEPEFFGPPPDFRLLFQRWTGGATVLGMLWR